MSGACRKVWGTYRQAVELGQADLLQQLQFTHPTHGSVSVQRKNKIQTHASLQTKASAEKRGSTHLPVGLDIDRGLAVLHAVPTHAATEAVVALAPTAASQECSEFRDRGQKRDRASEAPSVNVATHGSIDAQYNSSLHGTSSKVNDMPTIQQDEQ